MTINRHATVSRIVQSIFRYLCIGGTVIACVALIIGGLERIAHELAGKQTEANIFFKILANIRVSVALAWTAAAGGVGWGITERRLRKRAVRRLSERVRELEERLNPDRQSSNIDSGGGTNKEDK